MIVLVIVLVPATVLAAAWFWLLGRVTREDWVTAAYNRVLDGGWRKNACAGRTPGGRKCWRGITAWPPRSWAWCWAGTPKRRLKSSGGRARLCAAAICGA